MILSGELFYFGTSDLRPFSLPLSLCGGCRCRISGLGRRSRLKGPVDGELSCHCHSGTINYRWSRSLNVFHACCVNSAPLSSTSVATQPKCRPTLMYPFSFFYIHVCRPNSHGAEAKTHAIQTQKGDAYSGCDS